MRDEQERKTVNLLIYSKRAFAGALAFYPRLVLSTRFLVKILLNDHAINSYKPGDPVVNRIPADAI
jgi:hypothetical protein